MGWPDRYFKVVDGGHQFFPNGPFSKGYIVDDAKRKELVAFVRRREFLGLLVCVAVAAAGLWFAGAVGFYGGLVLSAVFGVTLYWISIRSLLAGLPRTEHRRPFAEQLRATAIALPKTALYAMLAVFLIGTAGDAFFVYEHMRDGDFSGLLYASAEFAVFAVLLFVTVRVIQFRRRQPQMTWPPAPER
jgi:uncharacterized membrane protein